MERVLKNLEALKGRLGIVWHDDGLYAQALTHGSYTFENRQAGPEDNQRLEFLGDAVLELVISDYLYKTYPRFSEGDLTKLRAAVVCEPSLAKVARELGLGPCLMMGRGEERSGGRERPSTLADAFEALLGAVYLDQGLEKAAEFAASVLSPVIEDVLEGRTDRDYKTELQEAVQQNNDGQVSYIILKEEGPDHDKTFTSGVVYKNRIIGTGAGRSKKESEQQAAREALSKVPSM